MADRFDAARNIVRGPWVGDLPPEIVGRKARKARKDYKGPRRALTVRLPSSLAEELEDLARRAGLKNSELIALIVYTYLHRQRRM
jgi:hypothetical protein